MNTLIQLVNISAGYEEKAVLKDVNFSVSDNDFIGVIGPNGSGKTTLLKIITGLLYPVKGEMIYPSGKKPEIGYLPQINKVDLKFPILAKDVIKSGLLNSKRLFFNLNRKEKLLLDEIISELNIENLITKNIGELSGGEMQKIFLARALMSSPDLLALDEPDTFADGNFESELYAILDKLNEKMAILLVSHDVGIISSHVKSIACVNRTLHHHHSNKITEEILQSYNCPIDLITHGEVPHRVLKEHEH